MVVKQGAPLSFIPWLLYKDGVQIREMVYI